MTAPLSPDEGVRAALAQVLTYLEGQHAKTKSNGVVNADVRRTIAALSTPVPEEGLPRGSASAAEGDEFDGKAGDMGDDAMDALDMLAWLRERGWMVAVHNDYRQHGRTNTFWLLTHSNGRWVKGEGVSDALALGSAMDAVARLSAEAGDGVASALPSPLPSQGEGSKEYAYVDGPKGRVRISLGRSLPSQGEPVAFTSAVQIALLGMEGRGIMRKERDELFDRSLYTAEALAAERARADRAEEALRHALRGIEVAQLGLNRDGVQHAKLKQVEASLRTILTETPHDER